MTRPQRPDLDRPQQWSAAVATVLDEITDRVGDAARRVAEGWPDARGREWAERLLAVHGALRRHADAAVDLGRAIGQAADDQAADDQAADSGDPSLPYGPSLGGTGGRHVDDRRGVTIPRLNDDVGDTG